MSFILGDVHLTTTHIYGNSQMPSHDVEDLIKREIAEDELLSSMAIDEPME